MLKPRDRQAGFYDADYVCDQLIPPDSFYRKFREIVEPLIEDEHFETMYCEDNGRPAISPSLLAMATILQFYRNLSDREMERACMYDIEVKYALGLKLNERPFDHSSLGDFRKRLLENGKEKEIFDRLLSHLVGQGLIEKDEIQRIDATHVIADIAIPTMVTLVKKGIYEILKSLKRRHEGTLKKVEGEIKLSEYTKEKINLEAPGRMDMEKKKKKLVEVVNDAHVVLKRAEGIKADRNLKKGIELLTSSLGSLGTVLRKRSMNNILQAIYRENMTQPLSTITGYGYDTQDNLATVTDPNSNVTSYYNDDFGRKNQTGSPDTGTTDYLYDDAGNLLQRFDAKETVVNYTYDALNRLTAIQFPADPTQNVTFTYDSTQVTYGVGRLTGRADPSGSYTFYYDANGNLTREDKTINSVLYTTQYTYNNNNILTSITYPSGRVITHIPDQIGRISQVSTTLNGNPKTLASGITYLPFGGITGLTYGNGLSLTKGYDNQYRISSIVTGSILNLAYGYDPNGNIISLLDTVNPPGGEVLETPGTYSYQTGTNKLTHIEGTPSIDFAYDANANITSETGWTYVYDLSNQLVTVLNNGNQVGAYTYNGAGQRIKKVTQTETKIFHYDLWGHLIAETNQSGQMLAEYVYLGDQLLSMIKPGELAYYFHNDHLGTPQVLTDDAQTVAWKAVYTPFGEAVASITTVENPFRSPGQYYDSETGLHYNYFRYYNPQTGRYITPDPIGLEGGTNLFVYVAGNPLRWIDPFGLQTSPVPGALRGPDAGAWQGGYYGSRRGTPGQYYPHTGIDQLAPAEATAVAPISGTIEPSGAEAVLICRQIGTICCNGVERPRMQCFRVVHINPSVTSGNVTEGNPIGTVLSQNAPIPSHTHTEYYETTCVNGNPTLTRGDPTPFFYPMLY